MYIGDVEDRGPMLMITAPAVLGHSRSSVRLDNDTLHRNSTYCLHVCLQPFMAEKLEQFNRGCRGTTKLTFNRWDVSKVQSLS